MIQNSDAKWTYHLSRETIGWFLEWRLQSCLSLCLVAIYGLFYLVNSWWRIVSLYMLRGVMPQTMFHLRLHNPIVHENWLLWSSKPCMEMVCKCLFYFMFSAVFNLQRTKGMRRKKTASMVFYSGFELIYNSRWEGRDQRRIQAPGTQGHGPGRDGNAQACRCTVVGLWETV
jgi:hypothetical protein